MAVSSVAVSRNTSAKAATRPGATRGSVTRHSTERRLTPSEPADLLEPDRRARHGGAHRHHRQREEHDGVGDHEQRARLVEAALEEVLGHDRSRLSAMTSPGTASTTRLDRSRLSTLRRGKAHRQQGDRQRGERGQHPGCRRVAERVQRGIGQGGRRRQCAAPALDDQVDDRPDGDAEGQRHEERETRERHGSEPARAGAAAAVVRRPHPTATSGRGPARVPSLASSNAPRSDEDQRERAGGRRR